MQRAWSKGWNHIEQQYCSFESRTQLLSAGTTPVVHVHWNVVSSHSVRVVREHGMHEAASAQSSAVSSPPPIEPGHDDVAAHVFVVGHQKQPGTIGAEQVVHVVKAPQFATGAHVPWS
jgi:hypothetical protein